MVTLYTSPWSTGKHDVFNLTDDGLCFIMQLEGISQGWQSWQNSRRQCSCFGWRTILFSLHKIFNLWKFGHDWLYFFVRIMRIRWNNLKPCKVFSISIIVTTKAVWFLGFQIQFSVYDFIFETVFMMYETDYEERRDPPPGLAPGLTGARACCNTSYTVREASNPRYITSMQPATSCPESHHALGSINHGYPLIHSPLFRTLYISPSPRPPICLAGGVYCEIDCPCSRVPRGGIR